MSNRVEFADTKQVCVRFPKTLLAELTQHDMTLSAQIVALVRRGRDADTAWREWFEHLKASFGRPEAWRKLEQDHPPPDRVAQDVIP